jgi:hypothetical protein
MYQSRFIDVLVNIIARRSRQITRRLRQTSKQLLRKALLLKEQHELPQPMLFPERIPCSESTSTASGILGPECPDTVSCVRTSPPISRDTAPAGSFQAFQNLSGLLFRNPGPLLSPFLGVFRDTRLSASPTRTLTRNRRDPVFLKDVPSQLHQQILHHEGSHLVVRISW